MSVWDCGQPGTGNVMQYALRENFEALIGTRSPLRVGLTTHRFDAAGCLAARSLRAGLAARHDEG